MAITINGCGKKRVELKVQLEYRIMFIFHGSKFLRITVFKSFVEIILQMHTVQYATPTEQIHVKPALISHVRRRKVKSNAYL